MRRVAEDFAKLNADVTGWEDEQDTGTNAQNRIFYLAIPPSVFGPSCASIKASAMAPTGWTRVIVEKPFGCEHVPPAVEMCQHAVSFTISFLMAIDTVVHAAAGSLTHMGCRQARSCIVGRPRQRVGWTP